MVKIRGASSSIDIYYTYTTSITSQMAYHEYTLIIPFHGFNIPLEIHTYGYLVAVVISFVFLSLSFLFCFIFFSPYADINSNIGIKRHRNFSKTREDI